MEQSTIVKRSTPDQILRKLDEACQWAGIDKGRAIEYKKLFEEFFSDKERRREHIFTYNELMELVEIYELWVDEAEQFPGIKDKVKEAFGSGPILREDEKPGNSSNRPRNNAFEIVFAGKLLKAGVQVVAIGGICKKGVDVDNELKGMLTADVVAKCEDGYVPVECKRPQSKDAISTRIREGRKQLNGQTGIIAVDCSAALRPTETILEASTEAEAIEFLNKLLAEEVKPLAEAEFRDHVMGITLYLRSPVHTVHSISKILSSSGEPIVTYNQNTASSILCIGNASSSRSPTFKLIAAQLTASIASKGHALEGATEQSAD